MILRRRAEDLDRDPHLVDDGRQTECRRDTGPSDEVVPAGVADVRQRVIFDADADRELAGPGRRGESGGQTCHTAIQDESTVLQQGRDLGGCPMLVKGLLRIRMDAPAQR